MPAHAPTTSSSTRLLTRRRFVVFISLAAIATASVLWGPRIAFHLLPPTMTGEARRLAEVLQVARADAVAEIGAGRGALAIAITERVRPGGQMFVTELDPERLRQLRDRAVATGFLVIEATTSRSGLPSQCCDAIYMRNVYHHIGDPAGFNRELRRALRPGGRLAVMDFEPGALPFMGDKPADTSPDRTGHGVSAQAVVQELTMAGFRIERVDTDWGGGMFLVVAVAPDRS